MDNVAFAYLVTVLLFARSGLYAARGERPGLAAVVASLFQVTVVALIYAVVSGEEFSSYYIFYGSLLFAILFVSGLRFGYEQVDRGAAARRRLPAPRGARRLGRAHRGGRARAARRATSPVK